MEQKKKETAREAMWRWFSAVNLPVIKKEDIEKRFGKRAAMHGGDYLYRCILRPDHVDPAKARLCVGMWRGAKAEPVGVWYMTRGGNSHGSADGKNWCACKLHNMPHIDGYYFRSHYDSIDTFYIEHEEIGCREWAAEVAREVIGRDLTNNRENTIEMLHEISYWGGDIKRTKAIKRKHTAINQWIGSFPALPDGLDEWLWRIPFANRHYLFYAKHDKAFGCSACGARHKGATVKTWRRGQTVTCPSCGVSAEVIHYGDTRVQTRVERVMVVQTHRDRRGDPCAIARHFKVTAEWRCGEEWYDMEPTVVIALPHGRPACDRDVYYDAWNGFSDKNPCNQQCGEGYCFPDLSALSGTVYTGLGLEVAAAGGWRMNWNCLMRDFHGDPRVEYLIKGGFRRLVADLAATCYRDAGVIFHANEGEAVRATDILGLDGQGVARLRQHDGGIRHLKWLRSAYMCGWKLPDAVWDYMAKEGISAQDCSRMADRTIGNLSPEQIMHYIEKQRRGHSGSKKPKSAYDTARTWVDTLEMSMRLKLDFSKDMNVRPRDLKARHDELVEIINQEKNRRQAEEAEAVFPSVKPTCDRIRAVYAWSDGVHTVVVPSGVADIQREGRLLGHCVAANERYLDRIADGESYILFLRRASAPDTPWYTLEVEPGGKIRQMRTTGDTQGPDREEAKDFLRRWSRIVRERCSADELRAGEISHEKRLREFDELRTGGNIIRNGILKGHLLVDVLEADFRELNEPDQETKGAQIS